MINPEPLRLNDHLEMESKNQKQFIKCRKRSNDRLAETNEIMYGLETRLAMKRIDQERSKWYWAAVTMVMMEVVEVELMLVERKRPRQRTCGHLLNEHSNNNHHSFVGIKKSMPLCTI